MGVRSGERPRLGSGFTRLWTASLFTNLADGLALAAAPLLVASLTDDPVLVGGAVFAQQLPWLLFSLVSGVYVDRLDRRRLLVVVNLVRGLVIGGLAVSVWAGVVTIPLVYVAFFLLGTAETLADNAAGAVLPSLVGDEALPAANARLTFAQLTVDQFLGPPLGAVLFAVAAGLPFGVNAAAFAMAALVLSFLPRTVRAPVDRRPLWTDIRDGLRWMWGNRTLRTLAVSLGLMNVTLLAAFAVLVLYARERLGLGDVGYGLLLAAMATGGLAGAAAVGPLRARFTDSVLLRAGLVIETATHLMLATVTAPWLAAVTLVVFGLHSSVWGIVSTTWRQRVTPELLRGRVNSVHLLFSAGGAALGSLVSGPLAATFGITAPFWCSAAAMAVLTACAWRSFGPRLLVRAVPA